MKLIIAGGRHKDYLTLKELNEFCFNLFNYLRINNLQLTEIVSGACGIPVSGEIYDSCCLHDFADGVDGIGERLAVILGVNINRFPADWHRHGKSAGPIRNKQMAEYADALAVFPGGKGTANMVKQAKEHNLIIFDYR